MFLNGLAVVALIVALAGPLCAASGGAAKRTGAANKIATDELLKPASTRAGYIALLLVNEPPFPGEKGWVSEEDTKAAMLAVLWVCHGRIHHVPPGYRQPEIAATSTGDIINIITAGGEKGQVDGFYRDKKGVPRVVARVRQRADSLMRIAAKGPSGRFANLLRYAQGLADAYVSKGITGADRYAGLRVINTVKVTGRAYSWMTNADYYSPGGSFVKIPNGNKGLLGGNRFFTLKDKKR